MVVRRYGRACIVVTHPDGTEDYYEVEGITPDDPGVARRWRLTSPEGEARTVTEHETGRWHCDCPAFFYRKDRAAVCKHIRDLREQLLGCGYGRQNDRRPGEGLVGYGGPDAPDAAIREHDPPADPAG